MHRRARTHSHRNTTINVLCCVLRRVVGPFVMVRQTADKSKCSAPYKAGGKRLQGGGLCVGVYMF